MKRVGYVVVLLALAIAIVGYFAVPTRMELVSAPPLGFFESNSKWDSKRIEIERRLASAYWDCAVVTIQWKYPYGVSLPEDPPGEFRVEGRALSEAQKLAPQARERYWLRLQRVWHQRQSWHEERIWNLTWLTNPFEFWHKALDTKN